MDLLQILILAVVQGAAELLAVSSAAHVVVAEKLIGFDPTAPQMTLLLVFGNAKLMARGSLSATWQTCDRVRP